MPIVGDVTTHEGVDRTFLVDTPEVGPLPLYTLGYVPGERSLTIDIHGIDDTEGVCIHLDDTAIRELRDELSAIIWYWGDAP